MVFAYLIFKQIHIHLKLWGDAHQLQLHLQGKAAGILCFGNTNHERKGQMVYCQTKYPYIPRVAQVAFGIIYIERKSWMDLSFVGQVLLIPWIPWIQMECEISESI